MEDNSVIGSKMYALEMVKKLYNKNGIVDITEYHETFNNANFAKFNDEFQPGGTDKYLFYGNISFDAYPAINLAAPQSGINFIALRPIVWAQPGSKYEMQIVKVFDTTVAGFTPPMYKQDAININKRGILCNFINETFNAPFSIVFDGYKIRLT